MLWKIALQCPDLQIRVQVNADEHLVQNIYASRHVFKVGHTDGVSVPNVPYDHKVKWGRNA